MKKAVELCKLLIAVLLSKILPRKHYWIIAERGSDARDNGYHFFLYLKKYHSEINSLYFISQNSADYSKLAEYKESLVVPKLSIKSYILLCQSDVFAGTHGLYWLYPKLFTLVLQKLCGTKFVFLQHGITLNSVAAYQSPAFLTDIFICGAGPEYNYIRSNYGFKENVVQLTGFCRFDTLHDFNVKRQILLMPTWRKWMWTYNDAIEKNEWVQTYANLLKSKDLERILEQNDIDLIFYPHIEAQKYLPYFKGLVLSSKIKILDFSSADVQQLLKECLILITDYSSVFMDFAYMDKPFILYQFDYEKYRKFHQGVGYFDYKNEFGLWCDTQSQLLHLLRAEIKKGLSVDDDYLQKIHSFFPFRDQRNCERVFNAIVNIV